MSNNLATQLAEKVPLIVRELLGAPPIVLDESEMLYWATIASFAATVKPSDILAWFLIKDLADARVDIHRHRATRMPTDRAGRETRNVVDALRKTSYVARKRSWRAPSESFCEPPTRVVFRRRPKHKR